MPQPRTIASPSMDAKLRFAAPSGPALPLSLKWESTLMQDLVGRTELFLDASEWSIVPFRNPKKHGAYEAAVINNKTFMILSRDPSSESGWKLVELGQRALTEDCDQVTVVAGTSDVLIVTTNGARLQYWSLDGAGEVVHSTTGPGFRNARVFYQAAHSSIDPPSPILYFNEGSLFGGASYLVDDPGAKRRPSTLGDDTILGPYQVDGMGLEKGDYRFSLWSSDMLLGANDNGALKLCELPDGHVHTPKIPHRVRMMVSAIKDGASPGGFLYLGTDGHLYHYRSSTGSAQSVGAFDAVHGDAVIDQSGLLHVYMTTSKHELVVLHQTGWGQDNQPEWNRVAKGPPLAIGLATDVTRIQVDDAPTDNPTLVAFYDTGHDPSADLQGVRLLSQDPKTYRILDETIRVSVDGKSLEPYLVSRYRTQLTLLDANEVPVRGYSLTLRASSLVDVEVSGEGYMLDETTSALVATDMAGTISISSSARGLTTPSFWVAGVGLAKVEIKPDHAVQAYLAGKGQLRGKSAFSASTLEHAQVDGRPLVPPTTWSKHDPNDKKGVSPADAYDAIDQMIRFGSGAKSTGTYAGMRFQRSDPAKPAFQIFATSEELEAALVERRSLANYLGSWDPEEWWNELVQGVEAAATAVADFTIDKIHKSVDLAIWVGDEIVEVGRFVIETMTDAFNAISAFFNWLQTKASALVDWLKELFDFADIWDAKTAIEGALVAVPEILGSQLRKLQSKVSHDGFEWLSAQVDGYFSSLETQLGSKTFADFQKSGDAAQSARSALPTPTVVRNHPQANWMQDKLSSFLSSPAAAGPLLLPSQLLERGSSSAIDALVEALGNVVGDVFTLFESIATDYLVPLLSGDDDSALRNSTLGDLIGRVKKLAKDCVGFAAAIWNLFIEGVEDIFSFMTDLLGAPIDLGPLNVVYAWLQKLLGTEKRSEMTLAAFGSLLVAFPATIFYKVVDGVDSKLFPGGVIHVPSGLAVVNARGGSEITTGQKCIAIGTIAAGWIYPIVDLACDYNQDSKLLGTLDGVVSVVAQVFSWPSKYSTPGDVGYFVEAYTKGEHYGLLANWGIGIALCAIDFVFLAPKFDKPGRGQDAGRAAYALLAVVGLGMTIWEAVDEGENGWQISSNVLNLVSPFLQFTQMRQVTALLAGLGPELVPAVLDAKALISCLADVAGGGLKFSWAVALEPSVST